HGGQESRGLQRPTLLIVHKYRGVSCRARQPGQMQGQVKMRSTPSWPLSSRRERELSCCPRLEDLAGRALDLWHVLPAPPDSVVGRAHPVAIVVIPDPRTLAPSAIVGRRLTGRCSGGTNSSTT